MALVHLQGCYNFKDLGGLKGKNGKITQKGRIFRADCLSKLTTDDFEIFKKLNIVLVIDLRSPIEIELNEYSLDDYENIKYINIPLSNDLDPQSMEESMPGGLIGLYKNVVDKFSEALFQIFTLLAEYSEKGGIIFHCTAGKDRTGIVAALLLLLNGVYEDVIVDDYSQSYENMKPYFDRLLEPFRKLKIDYPEHILYSDSCLMEEFLVYFKEKYISAEDYFKKIGLSEDKIKTLKNLL